MGLQKYGSPEPIEPEAERSQRTAAREGWSAGDSSALQQEAAAPRASGSEDDEVHSHLPADDGVPEIP